MCEAETFGPWRQREALVDIAADGPDFLALAEGAAFIEHLHQDFASSIAGSLAFKHGIRMSTEEVVHFTLDLLLSRRLKETGCVAQMAAAAENPVGYLWATVRNEILRSHGTFYDLSDRDDEFVTESPDPTDRSGLTPLEDVVSLTFSAISELVPASKRDAVLELLRWAAANPPQRLSYDCDDRVAAHRHCPSLTIEEVIAVMKIAYGSRPRQKETSLMGQFLANSNFRVSDSGSHHRALVRFKNEFRAGASGSRMLTDWKY